MPTIPRRFYDEIDEFMHGLWKMSEDIRKYNVEIADRLEKLAYWDLHKIKCAAVKSNGGKVFEAKSEGSSHAPHP